MLGRSVATYTKTLAHTAVPLKRGLSAALRKLSAIRLFAASSEKSGRFENSSLSLNSPHHDDHVCLFLSSTLDQLSVVWSTRIPFGTELDHDISEVQTHLRNQCMTSRDKLHDKVELIVSH